MRAEKTDDTQNERNYGQQNEAVLSRTAVLRNTNEHQYQRTCMKERIRNMAARNYDERIADLQKRQEQLKAQEKALKKRQSADERKKRTKRLIEMGGIIESVLERPVTDDDKIRLLNFLNKQEANGKYFTRAMNTEVAPTERKED